MYILISICIHTHVHVNVVLVELCLEMACLNAQAWKHMCMYGKYMYGKYMFMQIHAIY